MKKDRMRGLPEWAYDSFPIGYGGISREPIIEMCHYTNHNLCGKPTEYCGQHPETQKLCGPFGHVCLKCNPRSMELCFSCRQPRYKCCC